jgi:hypothetical protein
MRFFRVVRNFERSGAFSKGGLEDERSIVPLCWREVGEGKWPELNQSCL